jgi:hypothetical protein
MTGLKAAVVRGVDVNMVNTVGWTACHAAAAGGQTKALRYLVKKMDADISVTDRGGNLAVHHAAKNGHVHALRTLQELGADVTKVRLSQAKGKAVRDFVVECYRKADKELEDGDDDVVEAVGYARKQSKSTAFWGPRRTPISCAIKKKIIKDKRKIRKEKQKAKRESNQETIELDPVEGHTNSDEEGDNEPSYGETVKQIKRRRRQKRRQRQKSRIHAKQQQGSNDKDSTGPIDDANRYETGATIREKRMPRDSFSSEDERNSGSDDSDDDGASYDDQMLLASTHGQFAALALTEDDSDSD